MKQFNPIECGLSERLDKDGEKEYVFIHENKVIGRIFFLEMVNTWHAYRIIHCVHGSCKEHEVFKGRISTNSFAKELFKHIFYS